MPPKPETLTPPVMLSVIIPALNEEDGIADIIGRLEAQQASLGAVGVADLEIIVVDDGSNDRTGEVAAGFHEVMRHTWLWLLILQALLYHLFYGGAASVLGPIVVGDGLGRPAWGWALSTMMLGFALAAVGLDTVTGQLRMTFGYTSLLQGFDFLIAVIGLFGLGEILLTMEEGLSFKGKGGKINPKIVWETWKLLPKFWPLRCSTPKTFASASP